MRKIGRWIGNAILTAAALNPLGLKQSLAQPQPTAATIQGSTRAASTRICKPDKTNHLMARRIMDLVSHSDSTIAWGNIDGKTKQILSKEATEEYAAYLNKLREALAQHHPACDDREQTESTNNQNNLKETRENKYKTIDALLVAIAAIHHQWGNQLHQAVSEKDHQIGGSWFVNGEPIVLNPGAFLVELECEFDKCTPKEYWERLIRPWHLNLHQDYINGYQTVAEGYLHHGKPGEYFTPDGTSMRIEIPRWEKDNHPRTYYLLDEKNPHREKLLLVMGGNPTSETYQRRKARQVFGLSAADISRLPTPRGKNFEAFYEKDPAALEREVLEIIEFYLGEKAVEKFRELLRVRKDPNREDLYNEREKSHPQLPKLSPKYRIKNDIRSADELIKLLSDFLEAYAKSGGKVLDAAAKLPPENSY